MAIDFSTASVPSARTLREEMESLRWNQESEQAAAAVRRPRQRSKSRSSGNGRGGGGRSRKPPVASGDDGDGGAASPKPWVLRHKKLVGFLSVFSIVMLVFGIYVAPVLIAGARAYREVFVESERPTPAAIAISNAQQTPVTAQQAAQAELPTPTPYPEWDGTDPITLLLLGVDRREDEAARSDTIILIRIDPANNTAAMLSIPRDTQVVIPGFGIQKVNAAYAFGDAQSDTVAGGGPGLVMTTIEANFGIHVDYFAEVDFEGFQKIIDTVGGITIDNPYPIKDDEYPADGTNYMRIFFPAGWQHLDGEQALIYARTRHDDGDAARNQRQQQVLMALREQALGLDLMSKAADLLNDLAGAFRTDLNPTQLIELARVGQRIDEADIVSYSLMPALTEVNGAVYYLEPDWNAVAAILSEFAGQTIAPPASLLANPDYSTPIVLRNSSGTDGMATRVAEVLETQGFTNVTIDTAWSGGWSETTTIADRANNLTTSMFLAGAIGVSLDTILVEGDDQYEFSVTDWRQPGMISIDLGSDTPDPIWYDAEAAMESIFSELGVDIETPEPTAIAATATPPIDYSLPANGAPSTSSDHAISGDQTGGPVEANPTREPSPTPMPTPTP